MSKPDVWTFTLDESGKFEETGERNVLLVGGVLAPGTAAAVDGSWRRSLQILCSQLEIPFPPHANELNMHKLTELRSSVRTTVVDSGATWLFVVDEPRTGAEGAERFVRYVRLLAEVVDLAARFVALQGGRRLEVRPAQRTVPMRDADGRDLAAAGLRVVPPEAGHEESVRAAADAETRQVLDALSREDAGMLDSFPKLESVEVLTANYGGAHAGLFLSDVGCHWLYGLLRDDPNVLLSTLAEQLGDPNHFIVVDARQARRVREIDRACRDNPPDLVRAGRSVAWLEGTAASARSAAEPRAALVEGSVAFARNLWVLAMRILDSRLIKQKSSREFAWALAAQAEARLSAKGGAYEGVWRALDAGWAGDGGLAQRMREKAGSRELVARLWRLTLECANHRGDVATAEHAKQCFDDVLEEGISLALLAERLHVANLDAVRLQNRLPAASEEAEHVIEQVRESAAALCEAADDSGALIEASVAQRDFSSPAGADEGEETLWRELSAARPTFAAPDVGRGRLYGTAARSLAFAGNLEEATRLAFRARTFFSASDFDLTFNATVLGRIELERARLGDARAAAIRVTLERAGAERLKKPSRLRESLSKRDEGQRFAFSLLLRALLWAPEAAGLRIESWLDALRDHRLYDLLSSGEMRSHPTELIARHAGEVLRAHGERSAGDRWLRFSVELTLGSGDSTLERLGAFSRKLLDDAAFRADGPPGSLLNPTFEYR